MISKIFINVKKCKSLYRVKISSHYNLGISLQGLGRFEDAEASYKKAIALKPDNVEARYNLGILLSETKQYEKAAEQFKLSTFGESKTGENRNQEENIDVVTGSLCLFPASLLHYTIPFESEEKRIVLAFDVVPV